MSNVNTARIYSFYDLRRDSLDLRSRSKWKLSSSMIVEKVNKLLVCPHIIIS